jgi:hypothetical protein
MAAMHTCPQRPMRSDDAARCLLTYRKMFGFVLCQTQCERARGFRHAKAGNGMHDLDVLEPF